jgi:hypothetical protein
MPPRKGIGNKELRQLGITEDLQQGTLPRITRAGKSYPAGANEQQAPLPGSFPPPSAQSTQPDADWPPRTPLFQEARPPQPEINSDTSESGSPRSNTSHLTFRDLTTSINVPGTYNGSRQPSEKLAARRCRGVQQQQVSSRCRDYRHRSRRV